MSDKNYYYMKIGGHHHRITKRTTGRGGAPHRYAPTALYARMMVDDVARLDLGYAPPFATAWDPILIAANVALKKMGKR